VLNFFESSTSTKNSNEEKKTFEGKIDIRISYYMDTIVKLDFLLWRDSLKLTAYTKQKEVGMNIEVWTDRGDHFHAVIVEYIYIELDVHSMSAIESIHTEAIDVCNKLVYGVYDMSGFRITFDGKITIEQKNNDIYIRGSVG